MRDSEHKRMFAYPMVQQQERLQFVLESLAPLRRYLEGRSRQQFDRLVRRSHRFMPVYSSLRHFSPVEFILLSFIIELLNDQEDEILADHPPFP